MSKRKEKENRFRDGNPESRNFAAGVNSSGRFNKWVFILSVVQCKHLNLFCAARRYYTPTLNFSSKLQKDKWNKIKDNIKSMELCGKTNPYTWASVHIETIPDRASSFRVIDIYGSISVLLVEPKCCLLCHYFCCTCRTLWIK